MSTPASRLSTAPGFDLLAVIADLTAATIDNRLARVADDPVLR